MRLRFKYKLKKLLQKLSLIPVFIFLAMPASTNYQLKGYGFGSGGGSLDSTSYALDAILGQQDGASMSSTTYNVRGGLIFAQMSAVPPAPTLTNSSNWYNKLLLVINNTGNSASDTKFAVAISDDNWVTTRWVQSDNTIGSTLGIEDYQTYANWGSGTGENIISLTANTTYWVRVKAMQGEFSETGLGPQASAATSAVTISFDIDVSSIDEETASPYSVSMGDLTAGSVTTATNKIWVDLSTNAEYGGSVYVYDSNAGLASSSTAYTISSSTANLASVGEGFGLRVNSASNVSSVSPYDGASDNVGVVSSTIRSIFTSATPITSGRGSIFVKAKASVTTPAAGDYTDVLTLIASGTF